VQAEFSPRTQERIKKFIPEWQPALNPLDLWAALGAGNRLAHEEGIHSVLDDENVDAVLVILLGLPNADFDGIREVYQQAKELHPEKPLYSVLLGGEVKQRWLKEVDGLNMPFFETTRIAIKALTAARRYALDRKRLQPDPLLPS
jgi:acyl-CoA synthetase (NDP forming)